MPGGPKINPSQRARMWAGLKRLGLLDKDDALAALTGWVGREVTTTTSMTQDEASTAIQAIEDEQLRREARQAAEDAQAAAEAPQEQASDD